MKCLIYCTMAKPYLNCDYGTDSPEDYKGYWHIYTANKKNGCSNIVNGSIVAEFDCDKVEEISNYGFARNSEISMKDILEKSCLTMVELNKYAPPQKEYKENDYIYALHISNLKVFDKPIDYFSDNNIVKQEYRMPKRPPQNMCYCYYKGELCVLISIRPEWVAKILNGEKTIEVRKQIVNALKELIK